MSVIQASPSPMSLAGIPLRRWLYGMRIWAATVVALATAFWLQLDAAPTAAVTVGILALQTHGQMFQKSGYRLAATGLGVVASIAITGLFSQTRDLFIVAVAVWLGVCVFVAGLFDGNRAYGAVLAGYTVSIVAVPQVDTPQNIFLSGLNRGAAIAIAIAALALVNSLTGAPSVYVGLKQKLAAARAAVTAFALKALQGETVSATATADLMRLVTGLRPEITALYLESTRGQHRGQAARTLAAALVMKVEAAYALTLCPPTGQSSQRQVADVLQGGDRNLINATRTRLLDEASDPSDLTATGLIRLLDAEIAVAEALADLHLDRRPARSTRLRLYRSRRVAAWGACRIMLAMMAIGFILAATNWPATSTTYAFAGLIAALGATLPDVRAFSKAALIGVPLAAAIVGVIQFLILDGVDQFELLALGLAPATIGAALLQSSSKPQRASFGFVLLVFVPQILAPSNPETYDPQSYLFTSALATLSAVAIYVSLILVPPPSEARRLRWIMSDAREDARRALQAATSIAIDEAAFHDADRIGQIGALSGPQAGSSDAALRQALLLAETGRAARAAHTALAGTHVFGAAARTALATLDASSLRHAARLAHVGPDRDAGTIRTDRDAAAALFWVAALAEAHPFADIEQETRP
jgi:uncharacterized membrane protein YccC